MAVISPVAGLRSVREKKGAMAITPRTKNKTNGIRRITTARSAIFLSTFSEFVDVRYLLSAIAYLISGAPACRFCRCGQCVTMILPSPATQTFHSAICVGRLPNLRPLRSLAGRISRRKPTDGRSGRRSDSWDSDKDLADCIVATRAYGQGRNGFAV